MTDETVRRRRDPILDPPRQSYGTSKATKIIALVVIVGFHAALFVYLAYKRFELELRTYSDEAVEVELIEPIEEPPPPPPPPPPPDTPPPPKLQVREAVNPPPNVQQPPPLIIETTPPEDRVEYQGPPQITQSPPPPPAPPAPPRPAVITNPSWSSRPSIREGDYPDRALAREQTGSATVRCTAQSDGRPVNCTVVSEEPAGAGFGAAAVRVVQRGRLSPRTVDGAAQNATFTVRIPFELGD